MPSALFCDDAKGSKIYPTQADVWKHARESGLVIDTATDTDTPRHVLDNGYEIRACAPELGEDPERNEREAGPRAMISLYRPSVSRSVRRVNPTAKHHAVSSPAWPALRRNLR